MFGLSPVYSALWLPSQNAPFFECLQPHRNTALASSAVTLTGTKDVPLWLPSQNGCFFDSPQAHQK